MNKQAVFVTSQSAALSMSPASGCVQVEVKTVKVTIYDIEATAGD